MYGESLTYLWSFGSFLSRWTLFAFLTLKREKKNFKDAMCEFIIDY